MSPKHVALIFTCSLFFCCTLFAQTSGELEDLPPPDDVETDEELQPEITIIQRKDATVEEYRLNGKLYMIKVTPNVGKPYYFVDKDGDGLMESHMSNLYNVPHVPQWLLFSW